MDEPDAILDYASPRKRASLRLPAVSRLAVAVGEGRVTIEESLAGQAEATAALAFGAVVLVAIAISIVECLYDFRHHRFYNNWSPGVVLAALAAAELATMVGVLQQTWRRTVLAVEYDDVRLSFLSPLRRRLYRWAGHEIADVLVVLTADTPIGQPLGELLVTRVSGGEIRLFTDHRAARLGPIATAVHDMLRQGRADPVTPTVAIPIEAAAPASAEPVVPADLSPRAEQTAGRLVDHQREMRERRREG